MNHPLPTAADKPLFTPGPLTTSRTVKQAMLRDLGSRDTEFIETVRRIRNELLNVAGVSQEAGYVAVLMQGSGTFAVEAVLSSAIPAQGKLLTIINGAYGQRLAAIAKRHSIEVIAITCKENERPDVAQVERAIHDHPDLDMVAIVHCETTSGIINPIEAVGKLVKNHKATYFVDSMSAFGAVSFDFEGCHIDFLVSSANKCIEGVPGFGFAICRREALLATEGWARSVSLDLLAQWQGLEKNGQFRFTPPTHVILAFDQALQELAAEGGVNGRAKRYKENHAVLTQGMWELGFVEYVPRELQGYIITSYHYPETDRFQFEEFYNRLSDKGMVIYPGKASDADCFRIGNIGRLFPSDIRVLLAAVRGTIQDMGLELRKIG